MSDAPKPAAPTPVRRRRSLRLPMIFLGSVVALFVAVIVVQRIKGRDGLSGGVALDSTRGGGPSALDAPPSPLTFLVGAVADIDVPVPTPDKNVGAAAYWVRDNEARAWNASVEVSSEGVVHLRGPIQAPWGGVEDDLAVVITPVGAGPTVPAECRPPCQIVWRQVRYVRPIVPSVPDAVPAAP